MHAHVVMIPMFVCVCSCSYDTYVCVCAHVVMIPMFVCACSCSYDTYVCVCMLM